MSDFSALDFEDEDFNTSTISSDMSAAMHARSTEEVFLILVTITHPNLAQPIYIVNDTKDELSTGQRGVISNGHEFVYLPFEFILPTLERDSIPKSRISMDNTSREIVATVLSISDPPDVQIQIALSSNPDLIEYDIQGFKLASVTYDALTIEGDLTFEQFFSEPYPSVRFTPSRFPGLFRGRSSQVGA